MIAVDTNILVYAHRRDSEWNQPAYAAMRELAEGESPWAIPWPSVHEFFAIVTHPDIYEPPSGRDEAATQVDYWLESPTLSMLGETDDHWKVLQRLIETGRVDGPMVHDARVAAICVAHGVRELWSADRDFSRFSALDVRNPLVDN